MGLLGSLSATLKLDGASAMTAGLRGVGQAASGLTGLLSKIQGPLALLGVSFGAFKSAEGIVDGLKGVFEAGRELQTLSRTTGESVGNLKMLQGAFRQAGLDAGAVPDSLRLLQRALGGVNDEGQPTATVFARLGLSIQQLKGQNASQQFQAIGAAINKLPDQASKAAAAMQIFGRSGTEMLALFSDPDAMSGLGKGLSAQAQIFQRQAATFSKITADLGMLSGKVKGFFVGLADQVAPVILPLLDKLKSIDLTQWGQQAGRAVRIAFAAFQQGRLGDLVAASLKVGIGEGINYLAGAIPPIASLLGELIKTDLEGGIDAVAGAFDGLGDLLEAGLLKAFEGPVRYLQAGVEASLETAQYLADKAAGKRDDTSGLAAMTDAQRKRHYEDEQKVMSDRFAALAKQHGLDLDTDAGVTQAASLAAKDSSYANAQKEYELARHFDPSIYATGIHSIDEIMASHADEPVRFGTEGAGRTAQEMQADGAAKIEQSFDQAALSSSKIGEELKKAAADVHSVQFVDTKSDRQSVAGIIAGLKLGDPSSGGLGAGLSGGSLAGLSGGFGKMQEGDRLARIGGYIGSGGPSLDFAKRTAAATEKVAQGVQQLVQLAGSHKGSLTATWN